MKFKAGLPIVSFTLLPRLLLAQNKVFFSTIVRDMSIYAVGGESAEFLSLQYSNGIDTNNIHWETVKTQAPSYNFGVAYEEAHKYFLFQPGLNSAATMAICDLQGSCTGLGSKNTYEPKALMSVSVDPNSKLAYYYGGALVKTMTPSFTNINASADFMRLDTSQTPVVWEKMTPSYPAARRPPRIGHTSNIINNQLFIMGGMTVGANESNPDPYDRVYADFNSVLVYDIVSNSAATVQTVGDVPKDRLGYSAVAGPDGRSIVIFGGYTAKDGNSHTAVAPDVYSLDTCTLTWSKKNTGGNKPAGVFGHGAVSLSEYMVVVLGKLDDANFNSNVSVLDMNQWNWVSKVDGNKLNAQASTSSCQFDLKNLDKSVFQPYNYDLSIVQNPRLFVNTDEPKKKGLGIGFGLFVFLLIAAALYLYRRRRMTKKKAALNPRWMRTMSSTKKGDGYPMFVYNKDLDKPNQLPLTNPQAKTYTASDHEQWEQELNSAYNDKSTASQDIWKRMHNLSKN
ncbi:hypothetical protein BY458DRAFT_508820 [Sporodiniella umbellata]|nr:hypothetical protein BY458DRAFT_508820 [Sporodiniella umbellata]